jgi:hypothetical protein
MPASIGIRLIRKLEQARSGFGADHALQLESLLDTVAPLPVRDADTLIRLHEALLFFRAFPASNGVMRRCNAMLATFHRRVQALRAAGVDLGDLDPMEVSGIAGTTLAVDFSYEIARWLHRRFPKQVDIKWEGYDKDARLAATLPRFLSLLDDDAFVEADVPYARWLRSAQSTRGTALGWLLARFERLRASPGERGELFDALGLNIRWHLGTLAASRSRNISKEQRIAYQSGPFIARREVDLLAQMAQPPLAIKRLSQHAGEAVLDRTREIMSVRRRELWGVTHGDSAQVIGADTGRGLQLYLWGLPPQRRLSMRAYWCGLALKNGVPINYIEAIGWGEWIEVGFNTFYTFRDGETAWNYAQALRLLHRITGMSCVSIYPYQIGQNNEEAIESGAFWFYRKLGFRPGQPDLLRIAEREERKLANSAEYRTPPRVLRELAEGHLFLELPGTPCGRWDGFRVRHIGFRVQEAMAKRWNGDVEAMREETTARVSHALGIRSRQWPETARTAFGALAPTIALIHDLPRWNPAEKRALIAIIRAKAAQNEQSYVRLAQRHARLRDSIIALGKPLTSPA